MREKSHQHMNAQQNLWPIKVKNFEVRPSTTHDHLTNSDQSQFCDYGVRQKSTES